MRALATSLALAVMLAVPAGSASAKAPAPSVNRPRPAPPSWVSRRGRFYGWQSLAGHLLTDAGVVAGLVGMNRIAPSSTMLSLVPIQLGIMGHTGVSVAVHATRGEWSNLGGGLGLALGLPAAGVLVGFIAALFSHALKENAPAPPHLTIGAAVGLHLAGIADVAAFSYQTIRTPLDKTAPPPTKKPVATASPFLAPACGGVALGVAGSF